jgi:hypothetical protein
MTTLVHGGLEHPQGVTLEDCKERARMSDVRRYRRWRKRAEVLATMATLAGTAPTSTVEQNKRVWEGRAADTKVGVICPMPCSVPCGP